MPTKKTPVGPRLTPKDSIEALRILNRSGLLEPGDTDDIKEALAGTVATYLEQRRAGKTDAEFLDWYETADLVAIANEYEADAADPTV